MKNTVIFLAVLLLISCSSKVKYSDIPQKTVIIGKVENTGTNQRIPTLMTWLYGINLGKQSHDLDKNGTIINKGNNLRIYDSTVFNKIVELTRK